jgi:hypothetical protein
MKRKEKVLLGAKKKRSGDVAPLWSRALRFVICLWHFLLALVPRKRFLERVEVGPKPLDLCSMTKEGFEGLEGGERCLLS